MLKPNSNHDDLQKFCDILMQHSELMQLLQYLRAHVPWAFVCAGVIRNLVWARLHGQQYRLHGSEIDIIFFDISDTENRLALHLQQILKRDLPHYEWDVVNQALVHCWYRLPDGRKIRPYTSVSDAISCWPETATAIAIRLQADDLVEVIAPCGIHDLMHLKLRWNDRMVPREVFFDRVKHKGFLQHWPKLQLVED